MKATSEGQGGAAVAEPELATPNRQLMAWCGLGVTLLTFALLAGTVSRMPIVWDEAYTLSRIDRVRAWFSAMRDPTGFAQTWQPNRFRPLEDRLQAPGAADIQSRGNLFKPRILGWFWPFAREEPHGHPPFYAWVALVGDVLLPTALELTRARLGTMLAFSLAAGGLFGFITGRWGLLAGGVSAAAWALHPHLFALGHYATYDGLLASLWLGTTLAFATSAEPRTGPLKWRWGWTLLTGLLWGMTLGTKFTGWFLIAPLAAWCLWRCSRQAWISLAISGAISLLTFVLITPPLWANPVGGLIRFFQSNLSRGKTIPIKTLFLGQVYETPTGSLPWYNVAVWVVLATPVLFLILELVGIWSAIRQRKGQPTGLLLLLSALTVLVLRSMPHTPGHDGTRQLAVGLGGLAALAGPGLATLTRHWRLMATRGFAGAALVEGMISLAVYMPVPLAYYSPLVGGLPGAAALGMEPTFYWDALSDQALQDLDERTPPGRTVLFASNPITWTYRQSGRLRSGTFPFEGRNFAWYVVQNRPGSMGPLEHGLARRLGGRPEFILAEKFGVPLIWAFPVAEVEAERQQPPVQPVARGAQR